MLFGAQWWDDSPEESIRLARLLDQCGYDFLWRSDSHVPFKDVYSYLTLCALHSARIRVAAGVSNLTTRDPTVVASSIATVNLISNGRAVLGLGRGDNAVRSIGMQPMKLEDFREKTLLVKALCDGKEACYNNQRIQLHWAKTRVPLYLAAYGPKMLQFAGKIADGVILQIAEPSVIKWMMKYVKEGASSAGRDLGDIDVAVFTACYLSDNLEKARDMVRYYPGIVSSHVIDLLSRYSPSELPNELVKEMERVAGKYDHSRHSMLGAEFKTIVPDSLVDSFTIVGNSDACISKIHVLERIGVTHVNLYLPDGSDKEHLLKAFAEQVIPEFK